VRARAALLVLALAAAASAAPGPDPRVEAAIRESVLRLTALQQLALAADAALDFSAAEDAATRALAAAGPLPALLCLRSEARAGRGDYAGAIDDAEKALALSPDSAQAVLRRAIAAENLGRPADQVLADYRRAAELDPRDRAYAAAAESRLAPRPRARGVAAAGLFLLASALAAWFYVRRRRAEPAARLPGPALPGSGVLAPREAARVLAQAAALAPGPDEARSLAESLYERLTGKPPYPAAEAVVARSLGRFAPPSTLAQGLPVGVDAFFARALHPEPERRFRTGAELSGAFRSLVDPAVD
jgi:tetratricopeptide (TPR) repeat protein